MLKSKLHYSPSKNELFLLLIFAVVALSALAINFLYLPEWGSLSAKSSEYQLEKTKVESLRMEYAQIDAFLEKNATLTAQVDDLRQMIPNYLSEEEIIASIDENAAKAGLDILGINLGDASTGPQKAFMAQISLAASNEKAKTSTASAASPADASAASAPPADANSAAPAAPTEGPYIASKQVIMNYKGSYDSFVNFLAAFESQKRQVYFRSNTSSRAEDGSISGALTMLVFSSTTEAPVSPDPNYPSYTYETPPVFGKANPFSSFPNYTGVTDQARSAMASPDFYVILNTYDDNSNKIIMGKYPVSKAQIFSDQNEAVSARLTLSAEGGQCTYSYELGDQHYSESFPLNAKQASLSLSVLSRARKSSMDHVAMTLSVENNTNLPLNIVVKYDDPTNPRFQLGKSSGNVQLVSYE